MKGQIFRNNLDYGGFVSSFSYDDYFVKDDMLYFSRKQLKRLLADEEIISIDSSNCHIYAG